MVGQPHLSNVLLREDKPYDPLKDFAAISLVATTHNVIVLGKGVEGENDPGSHRARQSEAGRAQLRLGRRRQLLASRGRAVRVEGEDRRRARAVPPGRRQPQRVARRHDPFLCLSAARDRDAAQGGHAQGAGGRIAEKGRSAARRADERGSGVSSIPFGIVVRPHRAARRCRSDSLRDSTPIR